MSPDWFQAFDGVLQEAEAAQAYFGYVDEYMWPVGRAAGRVFQKHPELANASLQWEVTDMPGGTQVELPQSFFTVAAQLEQEPKSSTLSVPIAASTFELADLTGVDLYGNASLGQTVSVEHKQLTEVSIEPACWKENAAAAFTIEARLSGPEGRLIASRHVSGGAGLGMESHCRSRKCCRLGASSMWR